LVHQRLVLAAEPVLRFYHPVDVFEVFCFQSVDFGLELLMVLVEFGVVSGVF
jgi:hypothetical protein